MKPPKKTKKNPYGLTTKESLVIEDVKAKVERGKPIALVESVEKVYDVKNRASAKQVVYKNMQRDNFREALVASLVEKKILGADSKVEERLLDGLDATDPKGNVNYDVRLKHIQEINKLAGVYAAETKKVLNLNLDMSEEDLDAKIKELQKQLE